MLRFSFPTPLSLFSHSQPVNTFRMTCTKSLWTDSSFFVVHFHQFLLFFADNIPAILGKQAAAVNGYRKVTFDPPVTLFGSVSRKNSFFKGRTLGTL